eukprot:EST49111.1 Hypothetical protein SS50377_10595 [Spironucleus salmonicida]
MNINKKKKLIQEQIQCKISLIEVCKQYFCRVDDTYKSDWVELYRLKALVMRKQLTQQQIINYVTTEFNTFKHQELLIKSDTNDDRIIALSARKYEILSVRVLDEQQQKLSARIKKSKTSAQLFSSKKWH